MKLELDKNKKANSGDELKLDSDGLDPVIDEEDDNENEIYERNYLFTNRKRLRSKEDDLLQSTEYRSKELLYHQHEFLKMNEVGNLITEAI